MFAGQFCSNWYTTITIRQCMFGRNIGAEGAILQELCYFVNLNVKCLILYKQCILCENPSLSFQYILIIIRSFFFFSDILKMCLKIFLGEKKNTNFTAFLT